MEIMENMCGYISQGDTPGKPEVKIRWENDTCETSVLVPPDPVGDLLTLYLLQRKKKQ